LADSVVKGACGLSYVLFLALGAGDGVDNVFGITVNSTTHPIGAEIK